MSARLTEAQRADRTVKGADLQVQVTDLAKIFGWTWVHFRPAKTQRGWRTPVEGPLGKGWPDLVLVRERDRRLIFAELKREVGDPITYDQDMVLASLRSLVTRETDDEGQTWIPAIDIAPQVEVFVWRPSDLEQISEILR